MIQRLHSEGLQFAYTAFDAGYGHLPWLLGELEGEGEISLVEVHSDQAIHLCDPAPPAVPERQSAKRQAPSSLQAKIVSQTILAWSAVKPLSSGRRLTVCEGEKGDVIGEYPFCIRLR